MKYTNAFLGKTDRPGDDELAAALGESAHLWTEFIEWMAREEGATGQEWKGIYVNKYGWSLRLKHKSRNIVYLGPGKDCFMVSFVLSDKAVDAAKAAHFPRDVAQALAAAPRYPEGTGLRLLVHRPSQMAAIRKLAAIKLTN